MKTPWTVILFMTSPLHGTSKNFPDQATKLLAETTQKLKAAEVKHKTTLHKEMLELKNELTEKSKALEELLEETKKTLKNLSNLTTKAL